MRVWARRDGVWSLAETLRIDAQSLGWLQVNGIAQRWNVEDGDMIAIEYTIALLSFECDTDRSCGPVVSIVDNVSNDPLTYLPHMSEF